MNIEEEVRIQAEIEINKQAREHHGHKVTLRLLVNPDEHAVAIGMFCNDCVKLLGVVWAPESVWVKFFLEDLSAIERLFRSMKSSS